MKAKLILFVNQNAKLNVLFGNTD